MVQLVDTKIDFHVCIYISRCNITDQLLISKLFLKILGAVEKTRTSTGYYPTTTSTLRVYQFRHDRLITCQTLTLLDQPQGYPLLYNSPS